MTRPGLVCTTISACKVLFFICFATKKTTRKGGGGKGRGKGKGGEGLTHSKPAHLHFGDGAGVRYPTGQQVQRLESVYSIHVHTPVDERTLPFD